MFDLKEYKKNKDYLVCIDSDGCAIDSMDIKHIRSFGPCMVDVWNLNEYRDEILNRWNEINLYTLTRGINRFKGLKISLSEVNDKYCVIDDLDSLIEWVDTTKELSNKALEKAIGENPSPILKKALLWSQEVNKSIESIPEEDIIPFEGVKDALKYAKEKCDVAIVSSANLEAVVNEWTRYGLIDYTDIVLAQNAGSKAHIISELLKKGYDKDKVVMCGDSLGDLDAAMDNGVSFYPILVKKEKESWDEFVEKGLKNLINGGYAGSYQELKSRQFKENLEK